MTGHRLEDEDGVAKQVKFLGYVFAALILVLVIHTIYVSQAAPPENRPNSPANLEAARTPRGFVYSLVDASVEGQVVYVPAYSHIYQGAGDPYLLTITLSVRNTSTSEEIIVDSIRYFDTNGVQIRSYLDNPVRLPALGTTEVVVKRADKSGGSGANFLVEWHSTTPVTEPLIEAVMVATTSQQALAFARRGVVISVKKASPAKEPGAGPDLAQPSPTPTPGARER